MPEILTISKKPPQTEALNFATLRRAGIEYLEKVVSGLWTDYNVHDPGITLLELLCYGITDVTYRTTFPDADLFAHPSESTPPRANDLPFVTARHGLTNGPVTINDYRKLFLDRFPELRNVWLDPVTEPLFADRKKRVLTRKANPDTLQFDIQGLYRIRLLFQDSVKPARRKAVIEELTRFYHQHRNLCEDLQSVEVTPLQDILVCAEIQLKPDADVEETHARVVHELKNFLSPNIPRHSLAELVEQGLKPDEIFLGPRLDNGFILDSDLDRSGDRSFVRSSDLLAVILGVDGVKAVTKFQLNYPPVEGETFEPSEWELPIKEGHHPRLKVEHVRLDLFKGPLPFRSDPVAVAERLAELDQEQIEAAAVAGPLDRPIPAGTWRDLGDFTTLQDALPLTYGVGRRGFDSGADDARKSKARQLQAFLTLFDQLLSGYLGQLTQVMELFSTNPELRQSYFARAVADLPELKPLIAAVTNDDSAGETEVESAYSDLINGAVSSNDPWIQRRSAFLDHLLARFGEVFSDHVLMHYSEQGQRAAEETLEAKRVFLKELPQLSYDRLKAFDCRNPDEVWDTANVSGFEKRLGRLLGFASTDRRNLSDIVYELYEEEDTDAESEIRFRIIDRKNKKIILSGTKHFENKDQAIDEMRIAIRLAMQASNYRIKVAEDGRFYFVIIHVIDDEEDIVAMRKEFWDTRAEAEANRDAVVNLIARQYSEEGLFLIEHLLLRPRPDSPEGWTLLPPACACGDTTVQPDASCETDPSAWDPYSFRVHIVFPGYTARLEEPGFRRFIEQEIQRELPVHLAAKICYIGKEQLGEFEKHYQQWLVSLAKGNPSAAALKKLIGTLNELYTIYPAGTLHDCKDDGDEASAIVLNQSRLGTLPAEDDEPEPDT